MWEAKQHVQKKVYHTLGTLGKKTKGGNSEYCETTHTPTLLLWEFHSEFTKLKRKLWCFTLTKRHLSIIPSNLPCWHLSWVKIEIWMERSSFHSEKQNKGPCWATFSILLKLDMLCCRCQQNLRRCGSVDIHFMFWCWNGWCDQCGYINVLTLHSTGQSLWTKFLSINFQIQTVFLNVSCCRQNVLF